MEGNRNEVGVYLGIDPGKSGGAAAVAPNGGVIQTIAFSKSTERDISDFFYAWRNYETAFCILEKVHSMPKQGVRSMFTFGQNYGFVRACLICYRIKFIEIAPQKWQRALGCLSGGDKKVTRAKAQQLFPSYDSVITNSIADALLLAWSARHYMGG